MNAVHHNFRPNLRSWVRALPLGLLAGLVLAGCANPPTPYQPRLAGQTTGYTDRALTQNRYRVTFTGNTATPRETVESYLLLRAAEVARAAGFTSFMFDTRDTRTNTSVQAVPYLGPPDPFWGRRGPWGYWGGYGFAYDPAVDVVVRTNYEAYAEVVLLTPEQAAREPRAVNAADVTSAAPKPFKGALWALGASRVLKAESARRSAQAPKSSRPAEIRYSPRARPRCPRHGLRHGTCAECPPRPGDHPPTRSGARRASAAPVPSSPSWRAGDISVL